MDNKSSLSERDVITKFIIPSIEASGWDKQSQIREEVSFTAGRIFVKGKLTKRGQKKRADIIIYYKSNIPVAVVEAKDNKHTVGAGMQQALEYATTLDIPVSISSNGDGFVIQYRKNCGPKMQIENQLFQKTQISTTSQHLQNFGNVTSDTTILKQKKRKKLLFAHISLMQRGVHPVTISELQ